MLLRVSPEGITSLRSGCVPDTQLRRKGSNLMLESLQGRKFRSKGRTITEGEFALLTNLTWITDEIHTNKEYGKASPYGDRILTGPCILALALGLISTGALPSTVEQAGFRHVAVLGYEEVRFRAPLLPGDTITVESEVLDTRGTSRPGRFVMRVRDTVFKQTGDVVTEAVRPVMLENKEA